jgi:hypothetical protein
MSAMGAIDIAMGAKMENDTSLMAVITGVFDFRGVPIAQGFPYITKGNATEVPDHVFGTKGYDTTFTLHIWSIQPGTQECEQILALLNDLFDEQPLTISGFNQVGTWYEYAEVMDDPDDTRITHMPVRYRIGAQKAG